MKKRKKKKDAVYIACFCCMHNLAWKTKRGKKYTYIRGDGKSLCKGAGGLSDGDSPDTGGNEKSDHTGTE